MRVRPPPVWATMSGAGAVQAAGNAAAALLATVVLGPEQRGVMVVLITLGGIVGLLAGLGSGTAFRSLLPGADDRFARHLTASYTCLSVLAVLAGAAIAPGLSLASAPLIDAQLGHPDLLAAAGVFAASQVLTMQVNDAWFAAGRFRRGSLGAAATSAVGLLGLVSAAAACTTSGTVLTAALALSAQGVGALVVGALQVVVLRRHDGVIFTGASLDGAVALLHRGLPALGLTVGLALALRADRYILGVALGPAAVGIYSLAATLAEVPRLVPTALGQLFLRDVARGAGRRRLREVLRRALVAAALGGVAVALLGWVIVPLFGPAFIEARHLLVVLCAAELCFAAFFVASRGLVGAGQTRTAGRIGLVGAVLGLGLYSGGAVAGGSVGVAAASVLLYLVLVVVSCRSLLGVLDRRAGAESRTTTP